MTRPRILTDLANRDLETIPLDEIALLVAKDRYPHIELDDYRAQVDAFAKQARMRITGVLGGQARAESLSHYLFDEEGFRGNTLDYYNPSNSYLNDVLDQRSGIPISLSILYLAVGRRLDFPVVGIGCPGHFLVQYRGDSKSFFIDPFSHGKLLSKEACKKHFEDRYGDSLPFRPEFLEPSNNREILLRLLANLKVAHMLKKEFDQVLRILNQTLLFAPEEVQELRERGLIYYHMECFQAAEKDLKDYLVRVPNASDKHIIEKCLDDLRDKVHQIQ